jgi:cell division protein DivIC
MKIDKEFLIRYRYPLIIAAFMLWITFFDSNSLLSLWRIQREAQSLKKESAFFKKEIEQARKHREYLNSDPKNLEKFAREQYLMKKDNEDVFIIVENTGK